MDKAVFLDRDGTINVDRGYTHRIEDLKFEDGALDGLRSLNEKGYLLFIVTNQEAISKGIFSKAQHEIFMKHILAELKKNFINISGYYFCPHSKEENCKCRKPKARLINKAIKDFNIDKTTDVELGKRSGIRTILVKTGHAGKDGRYSSKPDKITENLKGAAKYILQNDN